jgi:hypothetical protein
MGQERAPLSEVEEDRRRQFLERVHRAYQDLREDPVAWGEMQAEQRAWDGTLADGLGADESWTEEWPVRQPGEREGV